MGLIDILTGVPWATAPSFRWPIPNFPCFPEWHLAAIYSWCVCTNLHLLGKMAMVEWILGIHSIGWRLLKLHWANRQELWKFEKTMLQYPQLRSSCGNIFMFADKVMNMTSSFNITLWEFKSQSPWTEYLISLFSDCARTGEIFIALAFMMRGGCHLAR